jgi:3-hydroxybutyryl-CoA dehydrogenase
LLPDEVRSVGVVGAGIMGSGIIEVVARSGIAVRVVEVSDPALQRGVDAVARSTAKGVERGKLTDDERDAILGRIEGSTDLSSSLSDVDLVIEAASEDADLKLGLFRELDAATKPDIVLATNTSSIPIVEIANVTSRADRVVGMHFFNPPPIMKLLEVVRGITTSEETVAFARGFGERLGKKTVLSKDRAGFIVNWLLIPYLNSAVRMLEEGFASREDIDEAVKLGLAHPMGPLQLIDLIGLDTSLYISEVLYEEFKDRLYAPPTMLKRMVAAGYLGRKSGRGFYEYE